MPRLALPMSPWRAFVEKWKGCQGCLLSTTRQNVVLARGSLPADVCFIAEAPGFSEDVLAQPLVGPAGHLFDRIVDEALPPEVRRCFTNLVCCIPLGEDGEKTEQPDPSGIISCSDRLRGFVAIAKPKLIVCVGTLAEKWIMGDTRYSLLTNWWGDAIAVVHPAFILRSPGAQQVLQIKRSVVQIRTAWMKASSPDNSFLGG